MGQNPQEAYANILTAFYGRNKTDGNTASEDKAKATLIDNITKGEAYLTSQKVVFSRGELLGVGDLALANIKSLNEYLNQLRALVPAKEKE